jgi:hypothetical protein
MADEKHTLEHRVDEALRAHVELWLADVEPMTVAECLPAIVAALWLLGRKTQTAGAMTGIGNSLGAIGLVASVMGGESK